jgi:hypothetical protein
MLEPWMALDFRRSVVSKPVLGLSLYHFIDEIRSLNRPPTRHFPLLDLDLLGQNMVSNLLSRFTNVRSASEHALISHNSHSEVVDTGCVIDPTHNLGSHVAWRSRRILSVFRPPDSCNTEVSDSEVSILVDDQVFWLDVSMDDVFLVANFKSCD